jgi:SecD-like export protein
VHSLNLLAAQGGALAVTSSHLGALVLALSLLVSNGVEAGGRGPCLSSPGLAVCVVDGWEPTEASPGDEETVDASGRHIWLRPEVRLSDEDVARAEVGYDKNFGEPVVLVTLTQVGRRRLTALSAAEVGHSIAVLEDGKVISAPRVEAPIFGGQMQITGGFTWQSADAFVARLKLRRSAVAS